MNTIHEYNNTIGVVDLADRKRGDYPIDKGVRNRKWWWYILFWLIGVMITNVYVIYLHVNLENRIIIKYLLSHHDFRKAVALAWINPREQDCPCVNKKEEVIFRFKSIVALCLFKHMRGSKEDRIAHK